MTVRARLRDLATGARRAGQHRAPRRDGPHPAADAHRAARGARARRARPRRRRAGRRLRARDLVPPVQSAEELAEQAADETAAPEPVPFVREEQQKRLRSAERALSMLGKVNPLALEEFSALEERHQFLGEQLEDLRRTRRDLLDIVREVDERVEQVFTEAWNDVNAAFDGVFKRLFPGGEGRLVLTDPSNMLTTGIEVEARPPGKKVKRLSLLSGGERSLVAVAFLVSLFKARPVAVLHPRRGRGGPRRHQPGPPAGDLRGAAREQPAPRDHPPEADHGGRRRALRREHARRRRLRGDQPAAPRGRACMSERAPRPTRDDYVVWRRPPPAGRTTTSTAT